MSAGQKTLDAALCSFSMVEARRLAGRSKYLPRVLEALLITGAKSST